VDTTRCLFETTLDTGERTQFRGITKYHLIRVFITIFISNQSLVVRNVRNYLLGIFLLTLPPREGRWKCSFFTAGFEKYTTKMIEYGRFKYNPRCCLIRLARKFFFLKNRYGADKSFRRIDRRGEPAPANPRVLREVSPGFIISTGILLNRLQTDPRHGFPVARRPRNNLSKNKYVNPRKIARGQANKNDVVRFFVFIFSNTKIN